MLSLIGKENPTITGLNVSESMESAKQGSAIVTPSNQINDQLNISVELSDSDMEGEGESINYSSPNIIPNKPLCTNTVKVRRQSNKSKPGMMPNLMFSIYILIHIK